MKINDLLNNAYDDEKYLTKENSIKLNEYMKDNLIYEIPVFGKYYSTEEVYYGLIEENNIFKYYICHRNHIINYIEFKDFNEALIYLFNCLRRLDEVSDYDSAYNYVINYFNLDNDKVLKLEK